MIGKEKLLNGYVKTDNRELVRLFLSECLKHEDIKLPIISCGAFENWECLSITGHGTPCGHNYGAVTKKEELTLDDFKPKTKTKVNYVKCEFDTVGECVQSVYDNPELYFYMNSALGEFHKAEYEDAGWYWKKKNLYRKVEKEIDWHDEAKDFLSKCTDLSETCDLSLCVSKPSSDDPDDLNEWVFLQYEFIRLCHTVAELTDKPE